MKKIQLKSGTKIVVKDKTYQVKKISLMELSNRFEEGCVCNNEIIRHGDWHLLESPLVYEDKSKGNEEEIEEIEFSNFFVISEYDASLLTSCTQEPVFYSSEFEMYLWGVESNDNWNRIFTSYLEPLE